MCKFFSFLSDGKANLYYLDWEDRKKILNSGGYEADSHSSIVEYHAKEKGLLAMKADTQDKLNAYEYNPLMGDLKIDKLNTADDSKAVEKKVNEINFKTIVEPLVIKKIIHPFKVINRKKITKKDIKKLRVWASVRDSVGDSVMASVRASVWDSVRDSVGYSVGASVGASVRASVGAGEAELA